MNSKFEVRNNLPYSDGGLGLVVRADIFYEDLEDCVFGALEFVDQELFQDLFNNNYPSLYITHERDYCIVVGPLSLCNNGSANNQGVRYPRFVDRNLLTDEELMYKSFRKEYQQTAELPLSKWVLIEFEQYALRMHIANNIFLTTDAQIMVDYGFVTKILVDLSM
jgi:hypothetical protein